MPRNPLTAESEAAMRQRMVQAGLQLYRSRGLAGVSFRRLAEALSISHTLPYRYFADKEALLAAMRCAVVREFGRYVRAHCPQGVDVDTRIRTIASAYIGYARRHTADYLLIFGTEQPSPELYPELLEARRAVFDFVLEVVQTAVDTGVLKGDARRLAHLYWVSLHGLMTLYAANQLVHGCTLEDLAEPIIEALKRAAATTPAVLDDVSSPTVAAHQELELEEHYHE